MDSKEKKNKVIFFDWNGTLSDSFFWEHMRNSEEKDTKKLYDQWDKFLFSKPKEYIQEWMRGKFSTESVLREIAKETDTQYEYVLKEFIKGCKSMEFVSEKLPRIIKDLRAKGYYVVIATNNMDCFTRWTVPSMGLDDIFDEVLNSFYLKGLKHDVDQNGESVFLKEFFTNNYFIPSNCIFLDDSIDKDGYITKLGIKYIQIENSNHFMNVLENLVETY